MVRLKERMREAGRNPALAFQFHYGTIKRAPAARRERCPNISIPLWYD